MARKKQQPARPAWQRWCQECVKPHDSTALVIYEAGRQKPVRRYLCYDCRGGKAPTLPREDIAALMVVEEVAPPATRGG